MTIRPDDLREGLFVFPMTPVKHVTQEIFVDGKSTKKIVSYEIFTPAPLEIIKVDFPFLLVKPVASRGVFSLNFNNIVLKKASPDYVKTYMSIGANEETTEKTGEVCDPEQ